MKDESLISKINQLREQASHIKEGWTNNISLDEPWVQERMKHCLPCEYNSANKEKNLLNNFLDSTVGPRCTACGCPIEKKLTVKRATCGLKDLGQEPKWFPLVVEGIITLRGTSIEAVDGFDYILSQDKDLAGKQVYQLNFGLQSKPVVDFEFVVFVPIKYSLVSLIAECSCTSLNHKTLGDGRYQISGKVSTLNFNTGRPTTRQVTLRFDKGFEMNVELQIQKV